ncbi:MAG: hypothetical protein KC415_05955, partial [Anaerolineales bacterium]|nr:hypothetical protein [Anaerolineales bacterium]
MTLTLHVLAPQSVPTPQDLARETAVPHDLIADLRHFPGKLWQVSEDSSCDEVAMPDLAANDYWTHARTWLMQAAASGIQDQSAIVGYAFWWTLTGPKFVPGLSDWGNLFAWIDRLQAVRRQYAPAAVMLHGANAVLAYLVEACFAGMTVSEKTPASPPKKRSQSPLLLLTRLLLSIPYLAYTLVKRPHICLLTDTNLLRPVTRSGKPALRDIYLSDVAESLQQKGWRTLFIEKYGTNASWQGLWARKLFFPSDLLLLIASAVWQRVGIGRRHRQRWQQRWQAIAPALRPALTYQGVDLAPVLLQPFQRDFVADGCELAQARKLWRRLLKLWRPKAIYVNNGYGRAAWPIIVAAKSLGIPTIEQQHGLIGRNHLAYLVPRELDLHTQFPLCDHMVLWGDYTRRFLAERGVYSAENMHVCGFPRINALLQDLPPRHETLARYAIPPSAQVALYTSNGFAQGMMAALLNAAAALPDVHWIVKLHPREMAEAQWQQAIGERGLRNVTVVRMADFYTLLAACDMHLSFASTTLIEAAVLGKLNLGFEIPGMSDPAGYGEANAYIPVQPNQLGDVV